MNMISEPPKTAVPEPDTLMLIGAGLVAVAGFRKKITNSMQKKIKQ